MIAGDKDFIKIVLTPIIRSAMLATCELDDTKRV